MNGNWSEHDMTSLGASTTQAALALTAFWGMVTVGRLLFAAIGRWMPPRRSSGCCHSCWWHVRPHRRSDDAAPAWGIVVFGLAGLGCSALLPLVISLGQGALPRVSAAVAGGVIAFYQVGYGIAAFGSARLVDHGVALATIYGWTAFAAAGMAVLAFVVVRRARTVGVTHPGDT